MIWINYIGYRITYDDGEMLTLTPVIYKHFGEPELNISRLEFDRLQSEGKLIIQQ